MFRSRAQAQSFFVSRSPEELMCPASRLSTLTRLCAASLISDWIPLIDFPSVVKVSSYMVHGPQDVEREKSFEEVLRSVQLMPVALLYRDVRNGVSCNGVRCTTVRRRCPAALWRFEPAEPHDGGRAHGQAWHPTRVRPHAHTHIKSHRSMTIGGRPLFCSPCLHRVISV